VTHATDRTAIGERLLQRVEHEAGVCRSGDAPTDDATGVGVDDVATWSGFVYVAFVTASVTLTTMPLAETINRLYKAEVIWRRGPWRSIEAVEYATLEWVGWFNNRR
jgi:hypothetical protein